MVPERRVEYCLRFHHHLSANTIDLQFEPTIPAKGWAFTHLYDWILVSVIHPEAERA